MITADVAALRRCAWCSNIPMRNSCVKSTVPRELSVGGIVAYGPAFDMCDYQLQLGAYGRLLDGAAKSHRHTRADLGVNPKLGTEHNPSTLTSTLTLTLVPTLP